ncbi:2537_t:CDS:2, partial [Racocetra fulgida]
MPETLVWCTCSVCSLSKDGGSWKLKSARTRHRRRDRRNVRSPSNDLELQNNIQNQAAYGFYQETFEPELYNLENDGIDEFENGLDCDDEFEGVDEFENGLDRNDEFE